MLLLISCHVDFLLEKLYNTSYSFKNKYGFRMEILQKMSKLVVIITKIILTDCPRPA